MELKQFVDIMACGDLCWEGYNSTQFEHQGILVVYCNTSKISNELILF